MDHFDPKLILVSRKLSSFLICKQNVKKRKKTNILINNVDQDF